MPDSARIEIRLLRESDLPAAMQLKQLARWNQTEADWRSLLEIEPNGCFAAVLDDQLVGTTTTTRYGSELAWVGMVLVRPENRRTGIATKLFETALKYLDGKVRTVKLDATADGKPVYERFGFQVESLIERWARAGRSDRVSTTCAESNKTIDRDTRQDILELDRSVFAADRSVLIDKRLDDSCVPIVSVRAADQSLRGYGWARAGSNATYVGPVVSRDPERVTELLDRILDELDQQSAYIDFNCRWGNGRALLAERGFEKQRDLVRMTLGKGTPTSPLVFAIAGPEIG
jgi:GNAT superfamily N-acetyltransferase